MYSPRHLIHLSGPQAFRNGHFRLTRQMQAGAEVYEVNVPPFSVGAAALSVQRWLMELADSAAAGRGGLGKGSVVFVVWRGKHGREARHATVKAAVLAMLAGVRARAEPLEGRRSGSHPSSPVGSPRKGTAGAGACLQVATTPFFIAEDSSQVRRGPSTSRNNSSPHWGNACKYVPFLISMYCFCYQDSMFGLRNVEIETTVVQTRDRRHQDPSVRGITTRSQ